MSKLGGPVCPSAVYRPNQRFSRVIRCKDADEVNEALAGESEATFVIGSDGSLI